MTKFNAKQFVKYLEGMGFFVRNTTVMDGVDDHTTLADSFTATIETENGTFEMTVTDYTILASKPNGTQRYWDNLTDARARSYVRQVLDFNAPVAKAEPEAAEAPQADVEVTEDLAPKTVRSEALNELTEIRPTDLTLDVWDDEGAETVSLRAWRGGNGRLYVTVRGQVRSVTEYMGTLYLSGVWDEVTPEPEEGPEPETDPWDLPGHRAGGESFVHPVNGATYVMNELGQCFYRGMPISREEYSRAKAQAEGQAEASPDFAELTPDQLRYLEVAGSVTHGTVPEQVARVADELGLRGLSREGIVAVRNSAVRHLGNLMSEAVGDGDWEALDRLIANMGGICEAVDRILSGIAV